MQEQIDAENIEAPQLLPGISLATDMEERKKKARLYKPELDKFQDDQDNLDTGKAFRDHEEKAKQLLFKEREVDNLMNLIYGASNDSQLDTTDLDGDDDVEGGFPDTNRYDVAKEKLTMFSITTVKKKLKSKFVTGQGSDQVVANLLNLSDSEGEDDKEKKKDNKEQLRKIEANDTRTDKKEKRKKRKESNNEKVADSDSGSEIESEDEEGKEGDGKAEAEDKGHAPLLKTTE